MSSADEIAAAFERVDELLAARAAERGISEAKLANHLHLNATVLKWVMRTGPDATTDRSIDLDEVDDDLAELVLRWVRS